MQDPFDIFTNSRLSLDTKKLCYWMYTCINEVWEGEFSLNRSNHLCPMDDWLIDPMFILFVECDWEWFSLPKQKHVSKYRGVLKHPLCCQIHKFLMHIINQKLTVIIHESRLLIFIKDIKESKNELFNGFIILVT